MNKRGRDLEGAIQVKIEYSQAALDRAINKALDRIMASIEASIRRVAEAHKKE